MLLQLIVVGYLLTWIFESESWLVVTGVLTVMIVAAGWISMRPLDQVRARTYAVALVSILVAGGATLALVTVFVLGVDPWYSPRYVIPLAGMIFAGSMNAVSIGAERFEAESDSGKDVPHARDAAFRASLIPVINSLFAVGLVSLPGMMTGQILAGVSPLIAVRYQIVVMCMLFGSAGIASAMYLTLRILDRRSSMAGTVS